MILPSGVTHRIFWDISSQLNATTQLLVDALSHVCVTRAFHPVAPPVSLGVRHPRAKLRAPGRFIAVTIAAAFPRFPPVCPNSGQVRTHGAGGGAPRETAASGVGGKLFR